MLSGKLEKLSDENILIKNIIFSGFLDYKTIKEENLMKKKIKKIKKNNIKSENKKILKIFELSKKFQK